MLSVTDYVLLNLYNSVYDWSTDTKVLIGINQAHCDKMHSFWKKGDILKAFFLNKEKVACS